MYPLHFKTGSFCYKNVLHEHLVVFFLISTFYTHVFITRFCGRQVSEEIHHTEKQLVELKRQLESPQDQ